MLDDDQRGPSLPLGDTWRFGLGGQYAYNAKITVGGAYELACQGNLPMNVSRGPVAGTVSGEYKDVAIHFVGMTQSYKF